MKPAIKRKWANRVAEVLETWPNQFISYQELADKLELHLARHACMMHGLGFLKVDDKLNGRPIRSARVVSFAHGDPMVGEGFFTRDEWSDNPQVRREVWKSQLTGNYVLKPGASHEA